MENFIIGFSQILSVETLAILLLGLCLGILFGATPGLSTSMGMAFMLPVTYAMSPLLAFTMMTGLYIGGTSGGLITATLIGIPGTPASVATVFDGYPMTKKGEPGRALGLGIVSSFLGGMISLVFLFLFAPSLANVAINFGPADYFSVSFFALTLIAGLSSGNMIKGLISGLVGLMLATVGGAPLDNTTRFTMGIDEFRNGFQLVCVLIGVYAVTELFACAETAHKEQKLNIKSDKIHGLGIKLSEFKGEVLGVLRAALIGTGIGILPGIGAGTSNILAYSVAKNSSKHPEEFGHGAKAGIIASETANNAVTGGALIPLLSLGIPGDAGTAIFLAALTLHGIAPGPLVFTKNGNDIYAIFAALIVCNILMILVMSGCMRWFIQLVKIPKNLMLSAVMVMCVVGAFGVNNRIFDMWTVLICGVIGYVMIKFGFDMTPLVMGFILGPTVETNLLRGLQFSNGNFLAFLQRPISAIFLGITAVYIVFTVVKEIRKAAAKQS